MSLLALLFLGSPLLAVQPVPDSELAEQRGGFRLPSGIDVALTVQSVTSVNGVVVLGTTFRVDQGTPTTTVYAPRPGEQVAAPASNAGGGTASAPTITYDSRMGVQVTPGAVTPHISLASGPATNASTEGLSQISGGGAVSTDNGTISQSQQAGLRTVMLQGPDLSITHFQGNAFGSAIANSGSDRTIDTQTVVSMDLRNAGPDVLGSAMLRAGDIANDALIRRGP